MPPPLRRVPSAATIRATSPVQQPAPQEQRPPAGVPDFMFTGARAAAVTKASADGTDRGAPEFYITSKEMAAAKAATGSPVVTVLAHFYKDYSKAANFISVPRVTIKQGEQFKSFTSAGAGSDCAIVAATGKQPRSCPVFVLVDHRKYTRQDGSQVSDSVKLWIPAPNLLSVLNQAVQDLAANLGCGVDQVDITQHEARITRSGTGTTTVWGISFLVARKPLAHDVRAKVDKVFNDAGGYMALLTKWLAPADRYTISKGGVYAVPSFNGQGSEEPPY